MNQPPAVRRKPDRKKELMKLNNLAKTVVLGLAVLVATGAYASNKGSIHVDEAVQVNGQELPAGDYSVRWQGAGPDVQVSFMRGSKEVIKPTAKLVDLEKAASDDAIVTQQGSGEPSVSQVRFGGKKTALAIGSAERAAMGQSMGEAK